MNHLFLLRHGENKANLTKEFSCRKIDYPLNEKGRLQAGQAGTHLLTQNIQAIYSSPLKRAKETAAIVGRILNQPTIISEAFREVNVGRLEEQPPTQESWSHHNHILQQWADGQAEVSFPGGESYRQLCERVQRGFKEACSRFPNQNILIVGHGGIFTLVLPCLCPEISLHKILQVENHNASLSKIQVREEGQHLVGSLISWSNTEHLSGRAADLVSGLPNEQEFQ